MPHSQTIVEQQNPSNGSGRILAVCLNPAWQKVLSFRTLVVGQVNRADALRESGGGKGVNLARAVCIDGRMSVDVALFQGGDTGRLLREELSRLGIGEVSVTTMGRTRTCTTVLDRGAQKITELIEPSARISSSEFTQMSNALQEAIATYDAVALCGTLPPGAPPDFYAGIADAARAHGAFVLADVVREVEGCLRSGVDVLKVNAAEIRSLTGESDLLSAIQVGLRAWSVRWIAVTDGEKRAYLGGVGGVWAYHIPCLPDVVNCIGAGDCASGVMLVEILSAANCPIGHGISPEIVRNAFRQALASASASCLTDAPALFDPHRAREIADTIQVIPYE